MKAGYKQTEAGVIPEEWNAFVLYQVCERISVGLATSVTKHYRTSGVPIVRNLNIKEGYFDGRDMLYVADEFAAANKSKAAKALDVLTVRGLLLFPKLTFQEERLRFAYSLNPARIFIGSGEFDGYLAFLFREGAPALLECPMNGNAAYIFREDWRTLSRCSKTDLLRNHASEVGRVQHVAGRSWQSRLKTLLGRGT